MKKTLFLLPIAILALAGCTGGGTNPEPAPTPTPTPTPAKGDYGTADNPLTVAEWKVKVAELVPAEAEAFSEHPFYVTGIADANADFQTGYQQFTNIFLKDDLSSSDSCKVQRAMKGESFDGGNKIFQNDTLVVRGYAEYYSGGYSLFPFDSDEEEGKVNVLSRSFGTSTVAVTGCDHATFTPLAATAQNGSTLQLTAAADSGWLLTVKVNNAIVEKVGDTYPVKVEGNTSVELSVVADIPEEDLPAGTYNITISKANDTLTTSAATSDVVVKLALKEDTSSHVYKKLTVTFKPGSQNAGSFDEFGTNVAGHWLTATAPNGKITAIDALSYYKNFEYYQGTSVEGTKLDMAETSKGSNKWQLTASMNNASLSLKNTRASGTAYLYSLALTVTVA